MQSREIGPGQGPDLGQRGLLDGVPVQPMQLIPVEDRRGGGHPLQFELRDQLVHGEGLARPSLCPPAEQGKIVGQRLGQDSHLAEAGYRGGSVALGEPLTIAAQNGGKVGKLRQAPAKCLINGNLPGSVGDVVIAADDMA